MDTLNGGSFALRAIADRVAAVAPEHITPGRFLRELGLDPASLSYDGISHRLADLAVSSVNLPNMLALIGAALYVGMLLVRTIVPLRVLGILRALFFIAYGAVAGAPAPLLLYLLSLPINVIRLQQMLALIKKARNSSQGDLSMDWLRPFMKPRKCRAGEVLFRRNDLAEEMFLTVTGKFQVVEIGIEIAPGQFFGELGFVVPGNRRTATVMCTEDGHVLTVTYERLLELYFQNPQFGHYFLRLATERLMRDVARLEEMLEAGRANAAAVPSQ